MEGSFLTFSILVILTSLVILNGPLVETQQTSSKPIVPAAYVFGDSTIDPGNNNGLVTPAHANFPPYGRDFVDGRPTGRFTNGKLITDILSGLAGISDLMPAYLDPDFTGQKLLTGASFGSAASGLDDTTALLSNVITLGNQVENFRHYRSQLADMIGQENASKIISGALFTISMGTVDFAINYYLNPLTTIKYSVTQYQDLLLQSLNGFLLSVIDEGASKIAIVGLPPFGCVPALITIHNLRNNTCIEEFNEVGRSFNTKVKALAEKTGFEEVRKGCCGSGLIEAAILCNELSPTCPDASKYVFWDSFHPTTTASTLIANDLFQQALRLIRF